MLSLRAFFLAPLFALAIPAFAVDEAASPEKPNPEAHEKKPGDAADKKDAKEQPKDAAKEEKPKEKPGRVSLGGVDIHYIVQTGMMPLLKDDGTPRANVFYVYY